MGLTEWKIGMHQYSSNAWQQYLLWFLASRGCLGRCLGFICYEMLFWMCYNIARFVINEVEWGNKQGNRNLCLDLSRLWLCCINEQFQLSILSLSVFICLTWPTHMTHSHWLLFKLVASLKCKFLTDHKLFGLCLHACLFPVDLEAVGTE